MSRRLEIDSLRTLQFVVRYGGVTRAAEMMGLSQSAVSHKLRRMEEAIEANLLNRKAGAAILTETGERLLAYADRILNLHDEALMTLSRRSLSGKIRLGLSEDVLEGLSQILGRFSRHFSEVSVHTQIGPSLLLAKDLEEGGIDLAVLQMFKSDMKSKDILLEDLNIHWVKSKDFILDESKPIPLMTFDQHCFYKRWVMENGLTENHDFNIVLECPSVTGMVSAIRSGMGVSLLSERHITSDMNVLDDVFGTPPATVQVIRGNSRQNTPAVSALIEEISQEFTIVNLSVVA
ncbi:LysR family transcriptional regulator [Curvivirga aplysinae]|uniref:LysR family transcriptional regulator n=1 Tax=Curvivirga aplysinae TaxID=2529852 RepID=UPI0012BD0F73|nr:LysR family transcriptional regulator [Curvivirga aplysinae]MTI08276.1 LysR family transcriptional regulator [Curvivirga aplysinae]